MLGILTASYLKHIVPAIYWSFVRLLIIFLLLLISVLGGLANTLFYGEEVYSLDDPQLPKTFKAVVVPHGNDPEINNNRTLIFFEELVE
jgi:hypothetical protein